MLIVQSNIYAMWKSTLNTHLAISVKTLILHAFILEKNITCGNITHASSYKGTNVTISMHWQDELSVKSNSYLETLSIFIKDILKSIFKNIYF